MSQADVSSQRERLERQPIGGEPTPGASGGPQLSVVLPVYNADRFLTDCLASVRASLAELDPQGCDALEVIVCDNRSTDRTLEIAHAEALDCSYRVLQPPEHFANRTLNWHHALSAARGAWMMMLHADDLMSPTALPALLESCRRQSNRRVVMISGRFRTFSDESEPGRPHPNWPLPALIPGEALRRRVLPFLCPFVPFTVMRRSAYEMVGGLNPRYELVQDWDLWFRLLAHGDLYYCPRELGLWRTHPFTEQYAGMFAREHVALASAVRELVPHLSAGAALAAMELQWAKAAQWLSDSALASLRAKGEPAHQEWLSTSREQAGHTLGRFKRQVAARLYWLRLTGTLRLLRAAGTASRTAFP
jgi:glycosyl transferase family 2